VKFYFQNCFLNDETNLLSVIILELEYEKMQKIAIFNFATIKNNLNLNA
jgi:hypothetical protein